MAGSLPLRMAAFGMLACPALLGVETLNSVRARAEQLQKAEASVTSPARALVQHADDMLSRRMSCWSASWRPPGARACSFRPSAG
ncbi:hypothetical protein [Teichococcus aestuarii]|uniref:hypothetical protein n=1 Tax=Teichococcus aestuarii TaxID=568898 RepID=UPI003613F591